MNEEQPEPLPTDPPQAPAEGTSPELLGWVDTAAQAEADAKAYTDQQIPLVAGRMVPRNEDRAPLPEDGTDVPVGTGWNQYDGTSGDLVQMWRWDGTAWQALDMSPQMIPVLDIGSATVGDLTGGRINVTDGPIVAGTPGAARVELGEDGLHAYDATGVETANIQGDGGTYRGGAFYTRETDGTSIYMHNTARNQWPALVFKTPNLYQPGGIAGHDGVLTDYGVWPNGTVVVNSGRETSTGSTSAVASGPNGAQFVARSGESRTYVTANSNGRAELISASGSSVLADELGGAQMEGVLGNRVLAGDNGNAELQSSGGAFVQTDNLGGAKMEGALGNRVLASAGGNADLQSSGGAVVLADSLGGAKMEGKLGNRALVSDMGSVELQSSGGSYVAATRDNSALISSSSGSRVNAFPSGGAQMTSAGGGLIVAHATGEASMWASNTERIRATSAGVKVTGTLTVGTTDVMAKIADLEARITALGG